MRAELMYERRSSEEQLSRFEEERRVWHDEKEKVPGFSSFNVLFQSIKTTRLPAYYCPVHPGHPLPKAAAAELHPDVPSQPRSGASDAGAEPGAGEQGHGGLRGPQWQQRHPL